MYTLNQEDRLWIESFLFDLISHWGFETPEKPFYNAQKLFSGFSLFPAGKDCIELTETIIKKWDIKQHQVRVSVTTDLNYSDAAHSLTYNPLLSDQFSRLDKVYTDQDFHFEIVLSKSLLSNKNKLVCDINRYVALVALYEIDFIDPHDYSDYGLLVDLACISQGWAAQNINELNDNLFNYAQPEATIRYSNYLLYATVVMCALHKSSVASYLNYFRTKYHNTLLGFEKQLNASGHLPAKALEIVNLKAKNDLLQKRKEAYANHDFATLANILDQLETFSDVSKIFIVADRGYLNIQLKNYSLAIAYISESIQLGSELYLDYNNRGYCKVQSGLLEEAYQDFMISQEYNPNNPFLYRNLGAYFMKLNELPKALKYFKDAMELKPDLDLIYFYLAHCCHRMGNIEKAKHYAGISRKLNEYNDSLEPELDF